MKRQTRQPFRTLVTVGIINDNNYRESLQANHQEAIKETVTKSNIDTLYPRILAFIPILALLMRCLKLARAQSNQVN